MAMMGSDMTMVTMGITVDLAEVPAGEVTIQVTNDSKDMIHEMVLAPIVDASTPLPYNGDEMKVDEDAAGHLGEVAELEIGQSGALTKTLKPGTYILYCNILEKVRIELEDKPIADVGPNDALIRVTTTTICGTDVHILKGGYPVVTGLTIGHEPVGIIEKLGSEVTGFEEGQRVTAGLRDNQFITSLCPARVRGGRTARSG